MDLPFCGHLYFTIAQNVSLQEASMEHIYNFSHNLSTVAVGGRAGVDTGLNVSRNVSMVGETSTDYGWFGIVIPVVCVLGVVGNSLNLITLTRRKMLVSMDRLEQSATYGLAALALSDMLFCVTVCPHSFIALGRYTVEPTYGYALYYRVYGVAGINLFLMISTWLVVTISVQRFLVVVYPLQARHLLNGRKTVVSILLVYLASIALSAPHFLHLTVRNCRSFDGRAMIQIAPLWNQGVTSKLRIYMRWIWPVIADFVPLCILALCNATLIKELRTAAKQRQVSCNGRRVKGVSHRVALTLIIIVVMFFVLVCPAEILKYIDPYKSWGETGYLVASVANVLQTCNFACNFALYCAVNRHFRRTVKTVMTCCIVRRKSWGSEFKTQYSSTDRTSVIRLESMHIKEENFQHTV